VSEQELESQTTEETADLEAEDQATETGADQAPASDVPGEVSEETEPADEATVDTASAEGDELVEGDEPAESDAAEEAGDADEASAVEPAAAPEEDPVEAFRAKLRRQEGDWYVIHSYAGYENRVKVNLETRIQTLNMEDYIFEIQVPMEEVVEIKNTTRKIVNRVRIPGYVLVRMELTDLRGALSATPPV
jgi:transcriptional antiterminator NusG